MIAQNSGSIVTLGSIAGMGAFPLRAYSPSKTAIMRLTQILAVEMGRFGVRVNGVAPTYVLSSTIKSRIDVGLRDPNRIRKAGALEMFTLPEYTAEVINFLCSDAAAAITGLCFLSKWAWRLRQLISYTLVICLGRLFRDQLNCRLLYELKHCS